MAHAGQLVGGFAFGVGAALMEELIVEDGVMAGLSLGETRLPTIRDIPALRLVLLPTSVGPGAFGAKMAGELSNAPVPPAIANAVADALGIRVTDLPLTPERVLDVADPERGGWSFRRRISLAAVDPAEAPPQEPQLPSDPSRSAPDQAWARHVDRPCRSGPTRYDVVYPGTNAVGSTALG